MVDGAKAVASNEENGQANVDGEVSACEGGGIGRE
jgi:hypothetical protein